MKKRMSQCFFMGIIIGLTFLVFFIGGVKNPIFAADVEGRRIKVVKRVLVNEGDTLWGIASSNYSREYDSINEYIEEIKRSNGISSDKIYKGQYIILPYYKTS